MPQVIVLIILSTSSFDGLSEAGVNETICFATYTEEVTELFSLNVNFTKLISFFKIKQRIGFVLV